MQLSEHDPEQIDADKPAQFTPEQLLHLSSRLLQDLKEVADHLNQTPDNSFRSPSSRASWKNSKTHVEAMPLSN